MKFKYLFFDFDGVMHGEEFNSGFFSHADMVTDRLLPYKDNFRIVISSSWREEHDLDVLQHAFNEPLNLNVIGVTPITTNGMNYHGRYLEIKEYCKIHNVADDQWLAIDDLARLFPQNCPQLVLTNSSTGITPKVLDQIEEVGSTPYIPKKQNHKKIK